jgi:ABC-2 type transport system permease protein
MVVRLWRNLRHDIRVYFASLRVQVKANIVLRGAFTAQVLGMILNNLALMAAWYFFFLRFGNVNGWGIADFVAMQALSMIVYGVIIFSWSGMMELPRYVDTGTFDSFLTRPASVMGQVGSSMVDLTTFGDMLLGAGLIVWYIIQSDAQIMGVLLMLVALLAASLAFWSFVMVLPYILAFYLFDSERLSRYLGIIFLDGMNYPGGVLSGVLRNIFLIAIPALLVGVVPVDVLRGLRWQWVGYGAVVALCWYGFSIWLFRRALRRYESANLVGAR